MAVSFAQSIRRLVADCFRARNADRRRWPAVRRLVWEPLEERTLLSVSVPWDEEPSVPIVGAAPIETITDSTLQSPQGYLSGAYAGTTNGKQFTSGVWQFQGPAPVQNGQLEPNTQPNRQVTGAIHTVLPHPTNADVLYIGAVNGGVWKTTNATATNPTWVPQTDFQGSLSIGALVFDRTDGTYNTLVAGIGNWSSFASYGGARTGVLRTTDGGTSWSNPGSSGLSGKNISGIAARGSTIVVTSSSGGILRSTDSGATFTAITSADFTSATRFLDLVQDLSDPTGQRLYASGEDKGIYRSDDFGATWSKITGPAINAEMDTLITNTSNNNTEMAVHPTTGRLYVAILISGQPRGIFYTNNGTAGSPTWTRMDVPVLPLGSGVAISNVSGLGVSPISITSTGHGLSTGNCVVINSVTGNDAANGLFWITRIDANTFSLNGTTGSGNWSGGGTWTRVTSPNPTLKEIDSETGSQGSIHFSITVDPGDENILYVGGDRQEAPNPIGDSTWGGATFRGNATIARNPNVAPSPQWDHLSHDIVAMDPSGGTANGTATHADSRDMSFAANGNLIEVDDGGIFKRTNPQNNTGDWSSLAGSLGVTEYHNIAYDTNSNVIFGGTQDNGTQVQRAAGNTTWDMFYGGDGGAVAVDTLSQAASSRSVRYTSSQYLGGFRRTVVSAANAVVSSAYPALTVTSGAALGTQFYTPVAVNNINGLRLLIGGYNGIYESTNQGDAIAAVGTNAVAPDLRGNPIDYGGRSGGIANEDVAYVAGGYGGVYVRTTSGGAFTATTPPSAGYVVSAKMDPEDWITAFAIDDLRVFMTTTAGSSWTNITGNLASVGASVFRSLEFVSGAVDAVLLGTNLGVFASPVASIGTWFRLGTGLPNAPVWDMDYDPADDVLVAGTLGRSAWSLSNVSQELGVPTVQFTTASQSGPENVGNMTITAQLSAVSTLDVTVPFSVTGTATGGGTDYTITASPITISAGSTTGTITVSVVNDATAELNETVIVTMGTPTNATLGPTTVHTATITDDDGGSIYGQKFNDLDGDGVKEGGEPGLSNWTIYLDSNNNGLLDATTGGGTYPAADVPKTISDNATVTSSLPLSGVDGTITDVNVTLNITHTYDSDLSVTLIGPGGTRVQLFTGVGGSGDNFTNTTLDDEAATAITAGTAPFTGSYRPGGLLSALDGGTPNGTWQLEVTDTASGDTGTLNSWSITLTTSTPTEPYAITAADGSYSFSDLMPGTYVVREVQQAGWLQTAPAAGYYSETLVSGAVLTGRDFGNRLPPGEIHGQKWNDLDGDRFKDAGEPGLDGWTIELVDQDTGTVVDTRVTSGGGLYSFTNVPSDNYLVREVAQPGWSQTFPFATTFGTPELNFNGQGYSGVRPPDTVGDVGLSYYVQATNDNAGTNITVYNKVDGSVAVPQFNLSTLATGATGGSAYTGHGDPIVLYDHLANRWVLMEFESTGNELDIFLSDTSTPTANGADWTQYWVNATNFPDYPKLTLWPDAYLLGTNEADNPVYALDRDAMLAGAGGLITAIRRSTTDRPNWPFNHTMPVHLDGSTPPPAGEPGIFLRQVDDELTNPGGANPSSDFLELWEFDPDFATPANSTYVLAQSIPLAEFALVDLSWDDIPQQGTTQRLDAIDEVMMWRPQYRNFGAYETLVGNFTVDDADTGVDQAGVRWFELRRSGGGSWTVYQEGTFAPDTEHRWMGAIAMDGAGNIALGYNVSSSSVYPGIRYAGRLAGDLLGTLPRGEHTLVNGFGSQTGSNRWGDYSAMSVDPVNDSTFWFTGEYMTWGNWATRIGSFAFDPTGLPGSHTVVLDPGEVIPDVNFGNHQTDATPPSVVSLVPPDDAAGVALDANLVITFSENVQVGAGNVLLKKSSDGSSVPIVVSVAGAAATIDPVDPLVAGASYYVEVDAGAFKDLAGNDFAGISGPTAWNFTTAVTGSLDADGNGSADALSDGILILRYLFDPTGAWNVADAVGSGATRTTREEIKNYLDGGQTSALDPDGNGTADALSDGILILRYLFDRTGAWNVADALGAGATRTTRAEIAAYLDYYNPGLSPAPPAMAAAVEDPLLQTQMAPQDGSTPAATLAPTVGAALKRDVAGESGNATSFFIASPGADTATQATALRALDVAIQSWNQVQPDAARVSWPDSLARALAAGSDDDTDLDWFLEKETDFIPEWRTL